MYRICEGTSGFSNPHPPKKTSMMILVVMKYRKNEKCFAEKIFRTTSIDAGAVEEMAS